MGHQLDINLTSALGARVLVADNRREGTVLLRRLRGVEPQCLHGAIGASAQRIAKE